MKKHYKSMWEFADDHPTSEEKEEALEEMTDEEIDILIDTCQNIYGKIWYSQHKKGYRKDAAPVKVVSEEIPDNSRKLADMRDELLIYFRNKATSLQHEIDILQ